MGIFSQSLKKFKQIRDIPYRIPLSLSEPNYCCSGKSCRLKEALEKTGYRARYRVCEFRWSDLPFPNEILKIPHEDFATHVYLEVKKDSDWMHVDPTWDSGLNRIFLISQWDEKSNTPIAVKPIKLFSHEKSQKIMGSSDLKEIEKNMEQDRDFFKAVNAWLETQRK